MSTKVFIDIAIIMGSAYCVVYDTILYYTILYYTILYYTILYYTIYDSSYTILYYILYTILYLLYDTILYSLVDEHHWLHDGVRTSAKGAANTARFALSVEMQRGSLV